MSTRPLASTAIALGALLLATTVYAPQVAIRRVGERGWHGLAFLELLAGGPTGYERALLLLPLAAAALLVVAGAIAWGGGKRVPLLRFGFLASGTLVGTALSGWAGFCLARALDAGPTLARPSWGMAVHATYAIGMLLAGRLLAGSTPTWTRLRAIAACFGAGLVVTPLVPHAIARQGDRAFHYDEVSLVAAAPDALSSWLLYAVKGALLVGTVLTLHAVCFEKGAWPRTGVRAVCAILATATLAAGVMLCIELAELPGDPRWTPNPIPLAAAVAILGILLRARKSAAG